MSQPDNKLGQPARRQFIGSLLAGTAAGSAPALSGAAGAPAAGSRTLFDKIYGCMAGNYIGSAMGVPVEGWPIERVVSTYGFLKTFEPVKKRGLVKPPGSGEDGLERMKFMCAAIIEKQDRITADDLVKIWVKLLTDERYEAQKRIATQFDLDLMAVARSGAVPPAMLGTMNAYSHLSTTIRCFQAIATINAGDPDGAARDVCDVVRVYQPLSSDAYPWGVVFNAAMADAFSPGATAESVIGTARAYAIPRIKRDLERGLELAKKQPDPYKLREEFRALYSGTGGYTYNEASANEIAVKALTIFLATKGNFKETTLVSINFGRDTDCLAAAACSLAGALSGASTIPADWIETVDKATKQDPHTISQLTIKEVAEGMHGAFQSRLKKMHQYTSKMGA
jgi:ADP-ribosylglycohydrolase